jgi:ribonuclease HII
MEKMKTRSAKRVSPAKTSGAKPSIVKKVVDSFVSASAPVRAKVSADEYIQRVQFRAYEMYVNRGYTNGNDLDDWLAAERMVKAELGL